MGRLLGVPEVLSFLSAFLRLRSLLSESFRQDTMLVAPSLSSHLAAATFFVTAYSMVCEGGQLARSWRSDSCYQFILSQHSDLCHD
jgi:hypothetical protein